MSEITPTTKVIQTTKTDTNPWSFDNTRYFTLYNAIFAIAGAINDMLGDQTTDINGLMAMSANLIGPQANKWQQRGLVYLNDDEKQIAKWAGLGNQEEVTTWSNQMNVDNTSNSQITTGYNNAMTAQGQQTSANTSNYQNLAQLSNTVVTGLTSSEVQNWVI